MNKIYLNKKILKNNFDRKSFDDFYRFFKKFDIIIYETDVETCKKTIDLLFNGEVDKEDKIILIKEILNK